MSSSAPSPSGGISSESDGEIEEATNGEDAGVQSAKKSKFDRRLPVSHSYLGNIDQGELVAESLFEEPGASITVPGQRMPLQFYTRLSVQFLANAQRQQHYFALLTADEHEDAFENNVEAFSTVSCHPVGTLFQIQNILMDGEEQVTVQVVGRQRCRLVNPLRRHQIYCEDISVLICEEISVVVLEDRALSSVFPLSDGCSFNKLNSNEKFTLLSTLSPHSEFVLKQCSTGGFVSRLVKWLLCWYKQRQIDLIIQQGLTVFSFWVAANIPMSLENKLELLNEDSTDRRIRIECRIVSQMDSLVCAQCDNSICGNVSDNIINLSVEGNSAHYVNPRGFVHDLFTVRKVNKCGAKLRGLPSAEFSWFPGYKWTILDCANCAEHLGWKFTSAHLTPRQFFGISRRSFHIACSSGAE